MTKFKSINIDLVRWAVREIRDLDELCRSMIPDYAPLDSNDMDKIHGLERWVKEND